MPCGASKALLGAQGFARRRAALAQLVEHRIRNAGVTGSSPVGGTSPSVFPSGLYRVEVVTPAFPIALQADLGCILGLAKKSDRPIDEAATIIEPSRGGAAIAGHIVQGWSTPPSFGHERPRENESYHSKLNLLGYAGARRRRCLAVSRLSASSAERNERTMNRLSATSSLHGTDSSFHPHHRWRPQVFTVPGVAALSAAQPH